MLARAIGSGMNLAARVLPAWTLALAGGACLFGVTDRALAQAPASLRPAPAAAAEQGLRWQDLSPSQRTALKPLEREWPGIDAARKQKWIELSSRVPAMSAEERARVQGRMADWAKLSPQERGQARLRFQEAKQIPPSDRQARWEDYQALTPEQKRQLAARSERGDKTGRDPAQAKSNIVPNPAFAASPKSVTPTVMQAQPGATTTLIGKRAVPPSHQQTGLPKIAATPEFVNKSTLLPHRGPQGAATRSAAASEAGAAQSR